MPRLSIMFLIRSLDIGGAQRQLVTLARGLHGRGHRVLVVTFYAGGPLAEELRREGVPLMALGKRGRWDLAGPLWRAVRCIRQARPDVVHGYLADANLFATVLARLAPPARAVWGVRASGLDLGHYSWGVRALFRLSAFAARTADLIIGNSESGRADHVAAGYPAARFTVIPNGIDTSIFRPDAAARTAARQAFDVAPGAPVIGLVGRIDPMKGHAVFVEAAARLAAERGDVQFLCVGDGDPALRASLISRARELGLEGRLQFFPARREVAPVYQAIDILTSASLFGEGFPNVIGEAMACGLPCVVTDAGDSAAVVGDGGIVVARGDAAALAAGWRRALARGELSPAPDPRRRIETEFSVERLVARTESALAALVAPPERPAA